MPEFCYLEPFWFETRCVSNHTACRFAEKTWFSARFGPGGAVLPPRVPPFSKTRHFIAGIFKKCRHGDGGVLSILWHRSAARTDTIRPFFPCSGGLPRVGNQRIPGGIIEIFRFGLQWKDTPKEYWQIEPVMPVLSDGAEWGLRKEFYDSFRTYPGDLSSSLKGWRRITMRYALCAHAFLSTIHMSILSDGYRE